MIDKAKRDAIRGRLDALRRHGNYAMDFYGVVPVEEFYGRASEDMRTLLDALDEMEKDRDEEKASADELRKEVYEWRRKENDRWEP